MQVLIVGYGYMGRLIAARHLAANDSVHAIARTRPDAENSDILNWLAIDLDKPLIDALPDVNDGFVYYLAPPPSVGNEDSRLKNFLDAMNDNRPRRIIYMSTTAVYGDAKGDWVDETTPLHPTTLRAQRRFDAERKIQQWCNQHKIDWTILRVTGIYGPDRLPMERIQKNLPILRIEEAPPSNRIHAYDLAEICVAAANKAPPRSIYNVSDGHPTTMSDYFIQIAKQARLPIPPQISLKEAEKVFSTNMMEFITESKKVANEKVLSELKVRLKYPTLEQGLAQCFT